MCLNKNCAAQAVRYLNMQLEALYKNARDCATHHRGHPSAGEERNVQFTALAEYSKYAARNSKQLLFRASFHQPELAFICNHDAILSIHITEGGLLRSDNLEKLPTLKARFRVSVDRTSACEVASSKDQRLTAGDIDLVVLDFSKAEIIDITDKDGKPSAWSHDCDVERQLLAYLAVLARSGHNVLYLLPHFDSRNTAPFVDFSATSSLDLTRNALEGVPVGEMNRYLRAKWMKAALLATEEVGDVTDWRVKALSELRMSEMPSPDGLFDVTFGRPTIQLVCSKEAIITFKVSHIKFYDNAQCDRVVNEYRSLSIAVLLDIIHGREEDGKVEICKVDINSFKLLSQKFVEPDFSKDTNGSGKARWDLFLAFIPRYLAILAQVGDHVVYRRDARWPMFEPNFNKRYLLDMDDTKAETWREAAPKTNLHSFDQVMVISQRSVDAHFVDLYNRFSRNRKDVGLDFSWLVNYTISNDAAIPGYKLSAKFAAPDCRFLSNEKAIVWVNIERGFIEQPGGSKIHFDKLCLAFEVPMDMQSHYNLPNIARATLEKTVIFDGIKNPSDARVKHILFDFNRNDFLSEYSVLDDLLDNDDAAMNDLEAAKFLVRHIKSTYLARMAAHGLHLLHSIPIKDKSKTGSSVYGLTGVRFHTYSNGTKSSTSAIIDRRNWTDVSADQRPVLVILGLNDRELSQGERTFELPMSEQWLRFANQQNSLGTLAISRRNFLDRIVDGLQRINRTTTLVPEFSRPKRHENVFQRVQLGLDDEHEHYPFIKPEAENLKFIYTHSDDWRYEHKAAGSVNHNGTYNLYCATANELTIPTELKTTGLEMKMTSAVTVKASFQSDDAKWSLTSGASLGISLNLQTIDHHDTMELDFDGVTRDAVGRWLTNFDVSLKDSDGNRALAQINLNELLRDRLTGRSAIDLSDIARHIEPLSRKVWGACFPGWFGYKLVHAVFNNTGDLFFELRPCGLALPYHPIQAGSDTAIVPLEDSVVTWLTAGWLGFSLSTYIFHSGHTNQAFPVNGQGNGKLNGQAKGVTSRVDALKELEKVVQGQDHISAPTPGAPSSATATTAVGPVAVKV